MESLLKIYPNADIYTLFYDRHKYGNHLGDHNVYASKLNTPLLRKHYQKIFPLFPYGVRSLRLKEKYDLIISSESGPAKGIRIPDGTPHICYIHTPLRYCYSHRQDYLEAMPKLLRPIGNYFFHRLRKWDEKTVDNVDLYIANSQNTANRVKEYYQREAKVIYPPIADNLFKNENSANSKKEHYVSFGAMVPYKKIDILIEAFNQTDRKLIVIGEGSEKKKLMKKAGDNISFKGELSWQQVEKILQGTKALLFPGEEDFGLIPLEVMSFGVPVIAYRKGGALETVLENRNDISRATGVFFKEQTPKSVLDAINYFEKIAHLFKPSFINNHASKFKETVFINRFKDTVTRFLHSEKA